MVRVRLPEDSGPGSYRHRDGLSVEQGETVGVGEWRAKHLVEEWGFEYGASENESGQLPFNPEEHTVSEVKDRIEDVDDPESVRAVRNIEAQQQDRTTAVEAIESRLEDLEG